MSTIYLVCACDKYYNSDSTVEIYSNRKDAEQFAAKIKSAWGAVWIEQRILR